MSGWYRLSSESSAALRAGASVSIILSCNLPGDENNGVSLIRVPRVVARFASVLDHNSSDGQTWR